MPRIALLVPALAALLLHAAGHAAPVNKCVINGSVTFQEAPCPATQPRRDPTLAELNAAEKHKRAAAASAASAAAASPPPRLPAPEPGPAPVQAQPPAAASGGFRCDGRLYCSQMHSCAEAKFFLANCPGVKMDGDGDGVPCEQQWCAR